MSVANEGSEELRSSGAESRDMSLSDRLVSEANETSEVAARAGA